MHTIKFAGREKQEVRRYTIEEFESVVGHLFVPNLQFENERTLRWIQRKCAAVLRKGLVDEERKWLGALYLEQIRSNYVADVSIRWIDQILGYGLFAEAEIKTSGYIGEYTGIVRRRYPFSGRNNDYRFVYPTSFFFFGKHVIDARDQGNEIRYANHSGDPNSEAISVFSVNMFHVILRAVKDISPNTQITYNYSDAYWKSRRRVPR